MGPREAEENQLILVRRDSGEKRVIRSVEAKLIVEELLAEIQKSLFSRAVNFVQTNTFEVKNFNEFAEILKSKRGFIKAPWCGDSECERLIKEETKATTRCIPFDAEEVNGSCIHCGRPAKFLPIWARAY